MDPNAPDSSLHSPCQITSSTWNVVVSSTIFFLKSLFEWQWFSSEVVISLNMSHAPHVMLFSRFKCAGTPRAQSTSVFYFLFFWCRPASFYFLLDNHKSCFVFTPSQAIAYVISIYVNLWGSLSCKVLCAAACVEPLPMSHLRFMMTTMLQSLLIKQSVNTFWTVVYFSVVKGGRDLSTSTFWMHKLFILVIIIIVASVPFSYFR